MLLSLPLGFPSHATSAKILGFEKLALDRTGLADSFGIFLKKASENEVDWCPALSEMGDLLLENKSESGTHFSHV